LTINHLCCCILLVFFLHDIQLMFQPHRKHNSSPLQRQTGKSRVRQHPSSYSHVCHMQGFYILKQSLHIGIPLCFISDPLNAPDGTEMVGAGGSYTRPTVWHVSFGHVTPRPKQYSLAYMFKYKICSFGRLHRTVLWMVTKCVLYSSLQFSLNKDSLQPVPVAARPKAWVYGCSPAEIVGSNPAESMDVSLL